MIRPPAVAGRFYPDDPARLREALDSLLAPSPHEKETAKKFPRGRAWFRTPDISIRATVAGEVFRRIEIPARVILIGPRHFPRGAPLAILSEGAWQTPLGDGAHRFFPG